MKNKLLMVALVGPVLFMGLWFIALEIEERTLTQEVLIHAQGYDPRDLIAGHYLDLRPDWKKTDCSVFENNICPVEKFNRYYQYFLSEDDGIKADKMIARFNPEIDMVFLYKEGKSPRLKDLKFDGKHWKEWLKQK